MGRRTVPVVHEIQQQRSAAVAVTSTPAAADLVTTLLQVNGIGAWTEAYAGVYPSVEWVEGHRVNVPEHAREEALALLAALDRSDTATLDPDDPPPS